MTIREFIKKVKSALKNIGTHPRKKWFLAVSFGLLSLAVSLFSIAYVTSTIEQKREIRTQAEQPERLVRKVLVLNFNPVIESAGSRKLTELKGWANPEDLTRQLIEDVKQVSGGYVDYQIVETQEIDDIPEKNSSNKYTDETYLTCLDDSSKCHPDTAQGNTVNYRRLLDQYSVCQKANSNQIDELWLWGGPYFGYWESALAGPGAYWYNSDPVTETGCERLLPIMGFNYERGEAEMFEDLAHRVEAEMSRVFRGVTDPEKNIWLRFSSLDLDRPGQGGCGNAHNAVNASPNTDYNRSDRRTVRSTCDDFLNYPNLTGSLTDINCDAWGCTALGYLTWWFRHLPRAEGITDGVWNNWWKYVIVPGTTAPPAPPSPTPTPTLPSHCQAEDLPSLKTCVTGLENKQVKTLEITQQITCSGQKACAIHLDNVESVSIHGSEGSKTGFKRLDSFGYPIIEITNSKNVTVRNLQFDENKEVENNCQKSNAQCSPSIIIFNSRNIVVEKIAIEDAKWIGVNVSPENNHEINIKNSEFRNIRGIAIWGGANKLRIENNTFENTKSNAILLDARGTSSDESSTIKGNTFTHNHRDAIFRVCGPNKDQSCQGGQVFIQNTNNLSVEKNTIKDGKIDPYLDLRASGIEIDSGNRNLVINNNDIYNNTGWGIKSNPGVANENVTITNNRLYNNGLQDIDVPGAKISGNCFQQNCQFPPTTLNIRIKLPAGSKGKKKTITLAVEQSGKVIQEKKIELTAGDQGIYQGIIDGPAPGDYSLLIQIPKHLSKGLSNIKLNVGKNEFDWTQEVFRAGDADGNNIVNIQDFRILLEHYRRTDIPDSPADFNEDGSVNIQDFRFIAENYRMKGD